MNLLKFKLTSILFAFALIFVAGINSPAQKNNSQPRGLLRGQAAIERLSGQFAEVAFKYGKSEQELRKLLTEDSTLWIDNDGNLLYVDDETPSDTSALSGNTDQSPQVAPFPYTQTFLLHSRPGSNRVIYLDFNGHVTSGTGWNNSYTAGAPINSEPFSLDADTANFSQAEQDMVQWVWQRVAEDYAPFDVDVTTQDPGDAAINRSSSSDLIYGTRAVLSPTNFTGSSIGGIAYVGVYNYVGNFYQPAFVMTSGLNSSDTSQRAKFFAEAVSHEVGHNLGLNHDGVINGASYYTGHGDWAPIMGVGYYEAVSQWSKGEYPNANNTQDDLAIIQTYGLALITDDHGNSTAGPTVLNGNSISASGLITTRADVDVFQFSTGAGNVVINVNPAPLEPNLDVLARILDAQGNVVATSNPTTVSPGGLAASFNLTLAAGTYFLTVDGTGAGDLITGYSDYGSLGTYSVTGTLVATNGQAPVAVINAAPVSGTVPLVVNFTGANSTDADGAIVSYSWNFGDGASSPETNPSHTYSSTGSFTAVLTVTDNSGLSDTESVVITVNAPANQLPVAVVNATPTSGNGPLTVSFSSAGSNDPDGTITNYAWTFGDGGSSSSANPTYTYNTVGTYTARLTVTDNSGATSFATITIIVQQDPNRVIFVQNITISLLTSSRGKSAQTVVTIYDRSGAPRANAQVSGAWSGLTRGNASGTTDANGQVVFTSAVTKKRGTFTFTVSGVSASGYVYNSAFNVRTSASITY